MQHFEPVTVPEFAMLCVTDSVTDNVTSNLNISHKFSPLKSLEDVCVTKNRPLWAARCHLAIARSIFSIQVQAGAGAINNYRAGMIYRLEPMAAVDGRSHWSASFMRFIDERTICLWLAQSNWWIDESIEGKDKTNIFETQVMLSLILPFCEPSTSLKKAAAQLNAERARPIPVQLKQLNE